MQKFHPEVSPFSQRFFPEHFLSLSKDISQPRGGKMRTNRLFCLVGRSVHTWALLPSQCLGSWMLSTPPPIYKSESAVDAKSPPRG